MVFACGMKQVDNQEAIQTFNRYLAPIIEELIRIYHTERNKNIVPKSMRFSYNTHDVLPQMTRIIQIMALNVDDKLQLFHKQFAKSCQECESPPTGFRYLLRIYQEAIWASFDSDNKKRGHKEKKMSLF